MAGRRVLSSGCEAGVAAAAAAVDAVDEGADGGGGGDADDHEGPPLSITANTTV